MTRKCRIVRSGSWSYVEPIAGCTRDSLYNTLDEVLSYPVPNAFYSQKYRDGLWDGRARLHKRAPRKDYVLFPSGSIELVSEHLTLRDHGIDAPHQWPEHVALDGDGWEWNDDYHPYTHQKIAVRKVIEQMAKADSDPLCAPGGILNLPIRSGKTLIAALTVFSTRMPTVFVVPSEYLANQAVEAFTKYCPQLRTGIFGLGKRELDADVIVSTVQTMQSQMKSPDFKTLREHGKLLILDEVHHNQKQGKSKWRDAVLAMSPEFTLGLSGTFDEGSMESESDEEKSSVAWLKGVCGPVLYSLPMSDLIDKGILAKPIIAMVDHDGERDDAIVGATLACVDAGKKVLVDCSRIGHTRLLGKRLKAELGSRAVGVVIGSTKATARTKMLDALESGKISVVVGTVLGEGADMPYLDAVVNAEGGSSYIATIQRMRSLTKFEGKDYGYIIDFNDRDDLSAAAETRRGHYRTERSFEIVDVDLDSVGSVFR